MARKLFALTGHFQIGWRAFRYTRRGLTHSFHLVMGDSCLRLLAAEQPPPKLRRDSQISAQMETNRYRYHHFEITCALQNPLECSSENLYQICIKKKVCYTGRIYTRVKLYNTTQLTKRPAFFPQKLNVKLTQE